MTGIGQGTSDLPATPEVTGTESSTWTVVAADCKVAMPASDTTSPEQAVPADLPVGLPTGTALAGTTGLAYCNEDLVEPVAAAYSWRTASAIALAIVAVAAITVTAIIISAAATTRAALAGPNGYFQLSWDYDHATSAGHGEDLWGGEPTSVMHFQSRCTPTECAMNVESRLQLAASDEMTLRPDGAALVSSVSHFTPCLGNSDATRQFTIAPQPDGSFIGTETFVALKGCGVPDDFSPRPSMIVPVVMRPTAPYAALPVPVLSIPDGAYRLTFDSGNAVLAGTAQWDLADDGFMRFSSSCDAVSCIVRSGGDPGKNGLPPMAFHWDGQSWVSDSAMVPQKHGGSAVTESYVLQPDGQGGFTGVHHAEVKSGPRTGSTARVPLTLTPHYWWDY